ncbi:MAG: ATP synthase subunit C [Treponema sp.]|jgi:V/A-type H+-transporting ATPase subunit K|nr:ATP synthase subunit C [Treponema sp.]
MKQGLFVLCLLIAAAPALPLFAQESAGTVEAPGRAETSGRAEGPAGGADEARTESESPRNARPEAPPPSVWRYFAAALAVGISCIAGGIAVGQIGSAAMGAMSENPELSGKALPYAGLAEGICLWGFLIAFFILQT